MDKVGIEKRVILIIDWGLALGEPEKSIRDVHWEVLRICSRLEDRLIGFAGVDPRRADAAKLLEWAFDELGAKGLKLHPTVGFRLDDEQTHRAVSIPAARRLPILIHVGRTIDVLSDEQAGAAALLRLVRAWPEASFIAGHAGYEQWRTFAREPDLPSNLYFDIAGWQDMPEDELDGLLEAFSGRVCFGTDSPFSSYNLPSSEARWLRTVQDRAPDPDTVFTPSILVP
jgi:predicted TIM-barrel fold metal-dependent hydrolase